MLNIEGPVVLLPPMGGDERCWDFIDFEAVGIAESQLIRYVYPGHGSAPRRPPLSFALMADELAERVGGPAHIVAIAAGVAIAAQFIIRHPGRVLSAVFVCAGFSPSLHGAELSATLERAERPLTRGMSSITDEMLARWFTPWARADGNPGVAYSRERLMAMPPDSWHDIWLAVAGREDVPDSVVESIDFPVSLVASLHDPTGGVKNTQDLHRRLPVSRLEYLPGPHMLHLERPAEVQAALERHVLWLAGGAERVERPFAFTAE